MLVTALIRGGKYTEARFDAALEEAGLSAAKWWALKCLAQAEEPLLLGQLAERLACVKSNVTQLVDRLEAESLVFRDPAPDDRRSIRVQLTEEGRRRFAAGAEVQRGVEEELLRRFTPEEQSELARLLAHLVKGAPAR